MKNKTKYVSLLLVIFFAMIMFLLMVLGTITGNYTYEDIPRRYITGGITSISEKDKRIELLLDNGEPASVTITINGQLKVYETDFEDEKVKAVDFSKLKIGQTVQCDVRLGVTLEKINSFHDCRQIFILTENKQT